MSRAGRCLCCWSCPFCELLNILRITDFFKIIYAVIVIHYIFPSQKFPYYQQTNNKILATKFRTVEFLL